MTPDTQPPARPSLAELAALATSRVGPAEEEVNLQSRILYLRSYLLMRAIIGFTGIALPVVLVVGDHLLQADAPAVRGALSDYYYSGMRDFFISGLSAAAVFLITYKIFERSLNNVFSLIAGLGGLVVAFFPTDRPTGFTAALTPLQMRLGEENVSHIHYGASGVFIVSLAIISFFFGLQEGRRSPQRVGRRARFSPRFWRWFHWAMAALILLSIAFTVLMGMNQRLTGHTLFIGETVAIVAFGLSWLAKGLELDVLLGPRAARRRWNREASAQQP